MTKLEQIKEVVSIGDLKEMVRECNSWNGSLDWLECYDMDEFDDLMSGMKPWEIARSCYFGSFNPCDEMFRFNGYGNLESLSDYEFEDELSSYEREIIDNYLSLYEDGSIDINDWLSDEVKEIIEKEDSDE